MKVGDLIRFEHPGVEGVHTGVVLSLEGHGGFANVLWQDGLVEEVDADYCEVVSESR